MDAGQGVATHMVRVQGAVWMTKPIKVGMVIIFVHVLLPPISSGTNCFGILSAKCCANTPEPLPIEAVYTGGATLIGLAIFSSAIGANVITGKNGSVEYYGAVLAVIGTIGTIGIAIVQGYVMLRACCVGLSRIYYAHRQL